MAHRSRSLALLVLMAVAASAARAADDDPVFSLCAANVADAFLDPAMDRLVVKLTEQGARDFAAFTQAKLGRTVRVTLSGTTFLRATVREVIASGSMTGPAPPLADHAALMRSLHASPCGATSPGQG